MSLTVSIYNCTAIWYNIPINTTLITKENKMTNQSHDTAVSEVVYDYDFPVELMPMTVSTPGGDLSVPKQQAVVRTDTNQIISTVGQHYNLLSHGDALNPILDKLKNDGTDVHKRIYTTNGGARLFANLYFPNREKQISKSDKYWPGVAIINSLDGTQRYSAEAGIYRLVCTNGMRAPMSVMSYDLIHSKNSDFEQAYEMIMDILDKTDNFTEFQNLADTKINSDTHAMSIVDNLLEDKSFKFPKKYRESVMTNYAKENEQNLWALYNSFNSVLEHELLRGQNKIGRSRHLDGNLFKSFVDIDAKILA